MAARATTVAQGFSAKLMKALYDTNILPNITNRDYEGEINGVGSKLNILDFDKVSEKTYANAALTADSITENNGILTIDQYKSFYYKLKTLENWLSYIKDPNPTIVTQTANERSKNMDTYVLGLHADVGAGNWIGTSYTTGTVTITTSTGAVVGVGTTFTEAMEGKPFKANGHSTWYRVKDYTSATAITIEDDKDDITSAYSGGTITAQTFEIQANTVVSLTTSNLLQYVAKLKTTLQSAEANGYNSVPDTDLALIVPPIFEEVLCRASGIALHVPAVYEGLVKQGFITELQGFKVFKSNRLSGNNTDGYQILAVHPSWMTFADKVLTARMEEDLIGDFGVAYKDLFVYGAKVKDSRRHMAAKLFATFA